MLPSDMNLKIRSGTVGYNNKIFVSDGKFSLGKNEKVKLMTPESHTQTAVRRRENCLNSFFDWNIYDMVPVSMN